MGCLSIIHSSRNTFLSPDLDTKEDLILTRFPTLLYQATLSGSASTFRILFTIISGPCTPTGSTYAALHQTIKYFICLSPACSPLFPSFSCPASNLSIQTLRSPTGPKYHHYHQQQWENFVETREPIFHLPAPLPQAFFPLHSSCWGPASIVPRCSPVLFFRPALIRSTSALIPREFPVHAGEPGS
jgi:hypothetical protein